MDTSRDVKLTDTNQPCGLTIDSFAITRGDEKLPFAGYSVVRRRLPYKELRRDKVSLRLRRGDAATRAQGAGGRMFRRHTLINKFERRRVRTS